LHVANGEGLNNGEHFNNNRTGGNHEAEEQRLREKENRIQADKEKKETEKRWREHEKKNSFESTDYSEFYKNSHRIKKYDSLPDQHNIGNEDVLYKYSNSEPICNAKVNHEPEHFKPDLDTSLYYDPDTNKKEEEEEKFHELDTSMTEEEEKKYQYLRLQKDFEDLKTLGVRAFLTWNTFKSCSFDKEKTRQKLLDLLKNHKM